MNTELFELCKEVYRRFPSWQIEDSKWFVKTGPQSEWVVSYGPISSMMEGNIPIYTSDYLLEKLPDHDNDGIHATFSVGLVIGGKATKYSASWECDTGEYEIEQADTPLKALLKLVIALDDAKELPHA